MKYGVIIPARTGSTRFPCKILLPYHFEDYIISYNALDVLYKRLDKFKVIIAASNNDKFRIKTKAMKVYGSESDVMGRVLSVAKHFEVENIIDITSDCPLIGNDLVSWCIEEYENSEAEYFSNVLPIRKDPDGFDVQIYKTDLLKRAYENKDCIHEHVGWNIPNLFNDIKIHNNGFKIAVDKCLTLDEPADYFEIQRCIDEVGLFANHKDIVNWLSKQDNMGNKDVKRK